MLSNKEIICPNNLLKIAIDKGPAKAVIVNAGKKVAILSTKQAVEANLITPIFVGDKSLIKDIAKEIKPTFLNHMLRFDDETKHELSNIIQYVVLAIIPIVTVNKVMKKYIPDADEEKGTFEISFEILIQLIVLLIAIYYINRLIIYIPTYSGTDYPEMNITPLLLIFGYFHT